MNNGFWGLFLTKESCEFTRIQIVWSNFVVLFGHCGASITFTIFEFLII